MAAGAVAVLAAAGCDFQLLEPFALPKWDVSLTMPLVSQTYKLESLAENDTTISQDTTRTYLGEISNEIQIEFRGQLDTTSIDSTFLEVALPAGAAPAPIFEEFDAPDANSFFSPVTESFTVTIALDSLLESTGEPDFAGLSFPHPLGIDFPIDSSVWNAIVTVPPVSPITESPPAVQVLDTTTLLAGNPIVKRINYIQLSSAGGVNKFTSSVENSDFPTSIDSVRLQLVSGPLTVTHSAPTVASGSTFTDSTDLASARLGTDLAISVGMQLPRATGTVIVSAGTDPEIRVRILLAVAGVDSVGIRTKDTSLVPITPEPLPLPADVQIVSGQLRSGEAYPINTISLTGLRNTLPFDIDFGLTFPNFSSDSLGSDSLRFGPYTLSDGQQTRNDTAFLGSGSEADYFLNPAGGGAIESFEFDLLAQLPEQDVALPLNGIPMGAFQATFGVGDLYFDSITGNFEISFDAVNTTIENIPTGFAGFQFERLSLTLFFHSQIDLPVALDLDLGGRSLERDSATVPIIAPLNFPGADPSNGDVANTVVVLDQNSVRTYWLPAGTNDIADAHWDTTVFANGGGSIVDVLNLPPETITVGGTATIQGQGTVAAGAELWGEFELIAPFAFIIPGDIAFLPVAPIVLSPMDESTRELIQTALLSATLTSQVKSHIPIGGKISMLASDSTLFPLALDFLDDIAAGIPTAARTGDSMVYRSLQAVLEADSIMDVDRIVFIPEESAGAGGLDADTTKAKRVEFISTLGDTFWVGRLFDMELPQPGALNDLGWVTEPGDTTQVITLDAERVGWLASAETVYLKTFITLYGGEGVKTIRATDSLEFAAFISFNMTSEIFTPEDPLDTVITVTARGDTSVSPDSLVVIDLGTIFEHEDASVTIINPNLAISGASSHAGIATVTRIYIEDLTRKMSVTGVGLGTARITVTVDDLINAPASSSFLVDVVPPPSASVAQRQAERFTPRPAAAYRWIDKAGKVRR